MKLFDIGDIIITHNDNKILIVGYLTYYKDWDYMLNSSFNIKSEIIYETYINDKYEEEKINEFLYRNVCYFIIETRNNYTDSFLNNIHIGLSEDFNYEYVKKETREEVQKYVLKKQLLGDLGISTSDLVSLYDVMNYISDYLFKYKTSNYDIIQNTITHIRVREFNNLYNKRVKLDLAELEATYAQFFCTYTCRYMYLYFMINDSVKRYKFIGKANIKDEEACFKLFLRTQALSYPDWIRKGKQVQKKDIKGQEYVLLKSAYNT